jgi:flagellar biosynthesis regulator FlaF
LLEAVIIMTKVSYTKAPISELIIGINFNERVFNEILIHKFINNFILEYPRIEYLTPLPDESLESDKNLLAFDNNSAKSGIVLHRLRNESGSELIQIQGDKLYFNWIRTDDKNPEDQYKGFSKNYNIFKKLLAYLIEHTSEDILTQISYIDLTYHDRIIWTNYISDLSEIENLLNIKLNINILNESKLNVCNTRFISKLEEGKGFITLSINTDYLHNNQNKILGVECSIKEFDIKSDIDILFVKLRDNQYTIFKNIINGKILEKWQ